MPPWVEPYPLEIGRPSRICTRAFHFAKAGAMKPTVPLAVILSALLSSLATVPAQGRPGWEMTDAELTAIANQVRAGKSLLPDSWPGGARVAVLLSFDVDNDTSRLASGRPPSIGAMSQGEYGARVGLKRVVPS